MLPQLNLPQSSFQFKELYGKLTVFDILRKKFVVLTPEEWVRQNFVHYLINNLKYPKSLIKLESGVKINELAGRSDILVYNREGKCFLLIECKAPEVAINNKVFEQVGRYNLKHKAEFIGVTNGLKHYCCRIDHVQNKFEFQQGFPEFM